MYSEQLGDFNKTSEDIISAKFQEYEILYGFDKFISKVISQNPTLIFSERAMEGDPPILKEFGDEVYYRICPRLPETVNFIESYMGLPDKSTIDKNKINVFFEDNAYYSLSLGQITLDEVNTIILTNEETGLPFHLLLSKDKKYSTNLKKTFLQEHAAYHLVKQIFDPEFVENYVGRATQMAQIFTDLVTNTKKSLEWKPPVKVTTPIVKLEDGYFRYRYDFMKLVYNGLNPIEVYLYFSYLFADEDTLKEQAFHFLTTTMINNKKAGH